jgi:hypothetical protein
MPKLTLSVDRGVIADAKRYAARRGTSVSRLVEEYLGTLGAAEPLGDLPPVTRRLAGVLRGARAGRAAHRRHLERRYR